MDHVRYEPDRVARVTLNRPQYRNAQSARLLQEVDAALAEAAADDDVRVIVLAGEGDAFSSGHDLGTPDQVAWRDARDAARTTTEVESSFTYSWDHFLAMSLRWRDIPKPTIAMVHGWCIFGGWLVASSMDLIVAADDTRFMTALLQYFPLPYDVGPRKAKELLFDAHEISAAEALELGFVNTVVPRERLEDETMALATRIAENSPFYLRLAKLAVNNAQDAMGFRAAVTSGHAHYHLSEVSQRQWARLKARERGEEPVATAEVPRRMPLVGKILEREQQRQGDGG